MPDDRPPGPDRTDRRLATHRRELGRGGEDVAAGYYTRHGYTVIDRNWRCRAGELDLVLSDDRNLVFCEVKTRSSDAFGGGAAAVGVTRQRRIHGLALGWLRDHPDVHAPSLRFDVAVVTPGPHGYRVEVMEGAF